MTNAIPASVVVRGVQDFAHYSSVSIYFRMYSFGDARGFLAYSSICSTMLMCGLQGVVYFIATEALWT